MRIFLATLLVSLPLAAFADDFFDSIIQADVVVGKMKRDADGCVVTPHYDLDSRGNVINSNTNRERLASALKQTDSKLRSLGDQLSKEYAGKKITWKVQLSKAVAGTEKTADVIVCQWVAKSIGKQLATSNNSIIKRWVVTAPLAEKGEYKKGDWVELSGTIKEITAGTSHDNAATISVTVALSGTTIKKTETKKTDK